MKAATGILSFALAAALAAGPACAGHLKRPVVVELFTSQGCESCPPADALLGRLATRPDVIAMSLPVTYWDMLGWKDTLASEANTRRQKAYAQYMSRGGVYTPQVIVDGVLDVVGSREADVQAAIAKRAAEIEVSEKLNEKALEIAARALSAQRAQEQEALRAEADALKAEAVSYQQEMAPAGPGPNRGSFVTLAVPVSIAATTKELHIQVAGVEGVKNANVTIWLFHLRKSATVAIRAGENDGRTMTYHNVVGDLRAVGMWKGGPVSIDLPREDFANLPHDAVAVVLQEGGYGRIVGATLLERPDAQAAH